MLVNLRRAMASDWAKHLNDEARASMGTDIDYVGSAGTSAIEDGNHGAAQAFDLTAVWFVNGEWVDMNVSRRHPLECPTATSEHGCLTSPRAPACRQTGASRSVSRWAVSLNRRRIHRSGVTTRWLMEALAAATKVNGALAAAMARAAPMTPPCTTATTR